jgi:hypothetical protein
MQSIYFYHKLNKEFKFNENEFIGLTADFSESLDVFAYLVNTIWQEKIKDDGWKYFAETLGIKYLIQASSLKNLFWGTNLEFNSLSKSIKVFDITSLYISIRSLIENYLTIFYLYIDDIDFEERRVRWIIYELSGLKSRQKLFVDGVLKDKNREKIENEKNKIEELKNELESYKFYSELNDKFKKRIDENNLAKLVDWREIIVRSKLSLRHFHRMWRLYSNYAHSEYLSLMQIKDYWAKAEDTYFIRNLCLISALMLNAVVIVDYKNLYPQISSAFSKLEDNQIRIINLLHSIGKAAT